MIRNAGRSVAVAVTLLCTLTVFLLGCVWIETNTYPPIADQKKVWNAIVEFADHNYTMIDRSYFEQYPFQGGDCGSLFRGVTHIGYKVDPDISDV